MEQRMIAHCGLVCTDCEAYKATQAEDMEVLERMAIQATEELGVEMTAADAMCDGCLATTGRQIPYCHECEIRLCVVGKHLDNCAGCSAYACDKIESFSVPGSPQRAMLDSIHVARGETMS